MLLVERWLVRVRMRNAPTISSSPAHIRDTSDLEIPASTPIEADSLWVADRIVCLGRDARHDERIVAADWSTGHPVWGMWGSMRAGGG